MSLKVNSSGSTWVDAKNVEVNTSGSTWAQAKSVKVWNGTAWVYSWVPPTTVGVTGPAWVLSQSSGSGAGSACVIQPATFTITLSKPTSVLRVSLQLSFQGGAWTEYGGWDNPTQTSWTHPINFTTNGSWSYRVVVTQLDGAVVTSTSGALTCYIKHLTASTNNANPSEGTTITLTAACAGDCAPVQSSSKWWYRWAGGGWTDWGVSDNPHAWVSSNDGGAYIDFMWQETFSDGSIINGAPVRVTVADAVPTHFHEVVPSGSSAAAIQAAMDRAYNHFITYQGGAVDFGNEATFACVELQAGGTYDLGATALHPRRGVRLFSAGSGASRAYVAAKGPHFMNMDNANYNNYDRPHYDWMVSGLRIDCFNLSGGFSVSHTYRYQIDNCHFWGLGPVKHYIEANSSGGYRADGTYNVRIIACEFQNDQNIGGRRVEDECIQLDYSWAGAASGVTGDGTATNNVLIDSCWFHDCPRAIGSHHFQVSGGAPDAFHSNIVIQSNTFQNVDPSQYNGGDAPNGIGSEGAVRPYCWQNVHILSNTFESCFQPVCLYIPADCPTNLGHPTYFRIASNYFRNVMQDRYAIFGTSASSVVKLSQVLIEGNVADSGWDTSPDIYFAGCDDTVGALAGVSESVHIRNNHFAPTNKTLAEEKAYNKYRAGNASNTTGVAIYSNTVSDGSVDNS